MSTTPTTTNASNNNNKNVDPAHPTQEPFTAPGESSNVNNCFCCGIFLVPLAALGGLMDQIMRKTSRVFQRSNDDSNNKA